MWVACREEIKQAHSIAISDVHCIAVLPLKNLLNCTKPYMWPGKLAYIPEYCKILLKNVSRYRYDTFRKKVSRYKIHLQMYLDTRYKILLNIYIIL